MRFAKRINFMSAHPEAYRQLAANPDLARKIARVEVEINARDIQYVPREKVATAQPLLKTGDIVGVTTSIDGLDCAHAGLCYRDASGVLRLLHGSTTQQAVILDAERAFVLEWHRRGILQGDARRGEDGNLGRRRPSALAAHDDLADFAGDVALGQEPGGEGNVDFAVGPALAEVIDEDAGALEN